VQASFLRSGYDEQQDRWWARHDADDYEVTHWTIHQGDFD
jgi:hypothetical protein